MSGGLSFLRFLCFPRHLRWTFECYTPLPLAYRGVHVIGLSHRLFPLHDDDLLTEKVRKRQTR